MDYAITRLFINSVDAKSKNTSSETGGVYNVFTIQLPNYIDGVVFIELLNTSYQLNQSLIQLEDWGNFSTSSGKVYWRYVDGVVNQRSVVINENVLRTPVRLRNLVFTLLKTTGAPLAIDEDVSFELEIYSRRC